VKNWFRRRDKGEDIAHALYLAAVAQARQPVFYAAHGVPDSVDGRFDLIVLHVYLLLQPLHRLAQGEDLGEDLGDGRDAAAIRAGEIAQALFDTMFGDMDRSLREMGVSDISVGKRVKHMAKSFYGRVAAYDEGLAGSGEILAAALERNLFGTVSPMPEHVAAMADYLCRQAEQMTTFGAEDVLAGRMLFAPWSGKGVDH
jgi:cytochrome b pre-mRNA-processing protein 3